MKKLTLEQVVKIIGDYRRNNVEVLDIDDLNEIDDCLSELNEVINQVSGSQTDKALQQLEPLLECDVQWVQDMCRSLVLEAVAPSSWDEIIEEQISKHNESKYTRTQAMCDNGFYQYIAELAYKGVDIDILMDEADPNKAAVQRARTTGIVRRIDDLNRLVLPKAITSTLKWYNNTPIDILVTPDGNILLKKYLTIEE